MLVAVFADVHAHADALEAVIAAAARRGVDELWSLGDMIGGGPDPQRVVARIRERCTVALMGNHDYAATGAVDPVRLGAPGSAAFRSIELACRARSPIRLCVRQSCSELPSARPADRAPATPLRCRWLISSRRPPRERAPRGALTSDVATAPMFAQRSAELEHVPA